VRRLAVREVQTRRGPARLHEGGPPERVLVLGHGAGGGVDALDLVAAADAALEVGWGVVLVEQPWRLKGRRVAEAPPRLDEAWVDVLAELPGRRVVGGRSAGARVACRTSAQVGAVGVLCLAFPLHPPGKPEKSRLPELAGVAVPRLVVQGGRDAFGVPDEAVLVAGADHGFRVAKGLPPAGPQIHAHVAAWLATLS
jgi:predicted alpha/beta-hydrolase family hydrolase